MVLGKYAHIFFAILYVLVGNEPCIADTPELKAAENRTDFKFKALELSNELIDKLKSDTKFTIDDERKFFVLRQRLWNGGKKRGQRERKMFYNAQCVNQGL